ncbi:DUF1761 domain-containing protein [Pseudoalteromonas tunicata]|jgi:hypothetical protein|nr:DUF1761 domain-containing protein [Pseudoalteromonas tunicata]ATC96805.1 hypothetical protein PTUN_b0414 [Pseudoalteromonas tunicata]MDP4983085.1 DUF1761 domain-containing protein [Pseudoalteromonas tunicata]MDP5214743.1 DUF1761 domain-containing protein [Pseudoalteromonas tunicata]
MFDLSTLNLGAILVATCSSFLLWGIWYSPWLFELAWLETSGLTPFDIKKADPLKVIGIAFIATFLISMLFGFLVGTHPGVVFSTSLGFIVGLCWVSSVLAINYVFEQKPLKLFLINAGYHTAQFTLIGLVFGLWPY